MERAIRPLRYALAASAVGYLLVYLAVALARQRYPFALEGLEGATLEHVWRVLAGQPLYPRPSLDFTPFVYTPLYYYAAALVGKLAGGATFASLRLVSLVASLGCLALLFAIVQRETGDRLASVLASGLLVAAYDRGGAWLDIARVDSLFLFLVLLALYLLRFGVGRRGAVAAGLCVTLAYLTKQSALPLLLPFLLLALWQERRRGLWTVAACGLSMGAAFLVLNALSDGWYRYYTLELPRRLALLTSVMEPERLLTFWTNDLVQPLGNAGIMALLFFLLPPARSGGVAHSPRLFYGLAAATMIGMAWGLRLHVAAYRNDLLTAYIALALLFGLAFHALVTLARSLAAPHRALVESFVYLVCLVQFGTLAYNPLDLLPTARDRLAGERLLATVARMQGDVYLPAHGYLGVLAGKPSHANATAMQIVMLGDQGTIGSQLATELREATAQQAFSAILLDASLYRSQWRVEIAEGYDGKPLRYDDERQFKSVVGAPSRPDYLYTPKTRVP